MRELLFLDGVARSCKDVATAEEHSACDTTFGHLQESELALFKGELGIAAAQLDTIGGVDFVGGRGVDAEGIELVIDFAGGLIRWPDLWRNQQTTEPEESDPEPHDRV